MKITTEQIKELREATGAGVLEAKKTLEAAGGDFDKAVDMLREKGAARAAKRSERAAKEGIVELYAHPGNRIGVILELNCETDFVARNEEFRSLAHELALQIAAAGPRFITREEVPQDELNREIDVLRAQAKTEGKPDSVIEKIVEGRLTKFYEEFCLLEQPFVKDDKKKISQLITETISKTGENIIVRRFARFELGESLED
jgi:elongation factor Ts